MFSSLWRTNRTNQLERFREDEAIFFYPSLEGVLHTPNKVFGQIIHSRITDSGPIKDCLSFCHSNHRDCCSTEEFNSIPEFRLIDCESRMVAPTPKNPYKYVALGYVWGDLPHKAMEATESLRNLPPTIEDALLVTLRLGFRFLWVDRYCIDQDSDSKPLQLRKMDRIYENAELTIVASEGKSPMHGLPGVYHRGRQHQRLIKLGPLTLASMPPRPNCEIASSKWHTRAWTFQEGLLSRRRLVFTERQFYFQCRDMYRYDCLRISPSRCHNKMELSRYPVFPLSKLGALPAHVNFRACVKEYTKRELSYPSDALNAVIGILNAFAKIKTPILHLWGVPIRGYLTFYSTEALYEGLTWWSKGATRRVGFPSWSWVGWETKSMGWFLDGSLFSVASERFPVDFRVQKNDGTIVSWNETMTLFENPRSLVDLNFSSTFIVEGFSFNCQLESGTLISQRKWVLDSPSPPTLSMDLGEELIRQDQNASITYTEVIIGSEHDHRHHALILRPTGKINSDFKSTYKGLE